MSVHRDQPMRCEFDGRFIADAYADSWNRFAYEAAVFCPDHERTLPWPYEERQAVLRELLAGVGAR